MTESDWDIADTIAAIKSRIKLLKEVELELLTRGSCHPISVQALMGDVEYLLNNVKWTWEDELHYIVRKDKCSRLAEELYNRLEKIKDQLLED